MSVVIWSLRGEEPSFRLPTSELTDIPLIYGGERSLYELAFAAAELGFDVELRGGIARDVFQQLAAASAGPAPRTNLRARRPRRDDIIVLPEGIGVPNPYASALMSPARVVVMLLAPPGLFGPGLHDGWAQPDPTTVPVDAVGHPEQFRPLAALGCELWTHSPGIARDCIRAGIECRELGSGTPVPFPDLVAKTHDIAVVAANRWAKLARAVAAKVDASCLTIPQQDNGLLPLALGRARILVWPSRIEGDSRIQREARAMGTVPVALSTNRYATDLDAEHGAVLVDSLDAMPRAIERLLESPAELDALSTVAVRTARAHVDWRRYKERVRDALTSPAPARRRFLQTAGDMVARERRLADARLARVTAELHVARAMAAQLEMQLTAELEVAEAEVLHLRGRRAIRMADGVGGVVRSMRPARALARKAP